jgi:hypothetical protein
MRDKEGGRPYDLTLKARQAVAVQPGTLFQLRNDGRRTVEVLYIVSPSYVFDQEGSGPPRFDDAELVAKTREETAASGYDLSHLPTLAEARKQRDASLRRLSRRHVRTA